MTFNYYFILAFNSLNNGCSYLKKKILFILLVSSISRQFNIEQNWATFFALSSARHYCPRIFNKRCVIF